MTLPPDAVAVRKSRGWRIATGLIMSAACIAVLLWLIDWRHTVSALRSMDVRWLAIAAPLLVGCYAPFAVRWWLLLRCDPALPPQRLFAVLMMGLAVNVTLPLRPGDALRAYLVGHVYGGGTSRTVASLVLERILDVATMLMLGGLVALKVKLPESVRGPILALSLLVFAAVAAIFASRLFARSANAFLLRMTTERHGWTRVVAAQLLEFVQALTLGGSRAPLALAVVVAVRLSPLAAFGAEVAGVCCAACGACGGTFVASGAAALASTKAVKDCKSLSWPVVDACCRCEDTCESAAVTSTTTLGILVTAEPLQSTRSNCLPATRGPPWRVWQNA